MKPELFLRLALGAACVALPQATAQTIEVTSTGVGIGTSSPVTSLTLLGPFTSAYMQLAIASSGSVNAAGLTFLNNAGTRLGFIYANEGGDLVVGRDQSGQIRFFSNGVERLTISSGGNVGIGTTSAGSKLDVQSGSTSALRLFDGASDTSTIDFRRTADGWHLGQLRLSHAGAYGANFTLSLHANDGTMATAPSEVMRIQANGNVGIGTTSPGYKLEVSGSVRATSFIANSNTYADFVFKPGYQLRSLSEVEGAIKAHGHLPDIPSEAEAKARGIDLAAMQVKLLQKIEELTLYLVAHDKTLQTQQQELQRLQVRNQTLEHELSDLKNR